LFYPYWLGIWTGAIRYIHCDWIRYDRVLPEIFNFEQMPSQSTSSRFLSKFNQAMNDELFPSLQHWMMQKMGIGKITIDFYSTVITSY
jgi:hypothetical protein